MTTKSNEYQLKYIKLINYKGVEQDISQQLVSITMEEDILCNTCLGGITLQDSIDLQQNIPIRGEEKLLISYRSRSIDEYVEREFFIYKLENAGRVDGSNYYNLRFVSIEHMYNMVRKDFRSFRNTSISNIVRSLMKNITTKEIDIEETSNSTSFISGKKPPFACISQLCLIAKSGSYAGNSYLFFEDSEKFNFKTIESLYEQQPVSYRYNTIKNSSNYPEKLFHSIIKLEVVQQSDNMLGVSEGLFGSTALTLDPLTRSFNTKTFNYFESFDKFKHTEKTPIPTTTSNFSFDEPTANWSSVISNSGREKSEYIKRVCTASENICTFTTNEESVLSRKSQMYQYFNTLSLKLLVPGNSNLKVGTLIEIIIPSRSLFDREEMPTYRRNDRFISGVYLITNLKQIISTSGMITELEVCKDSYNTDVEV